MNNTERAAVKELNPHLICALCGGYFIDATTIVECLHTFCRSCIVRYLESSKFCPTCDVQVHKTYPLLSIRPDKILQNVVYKLIPDLYKNEMSRRKEFYSQHPTKRPLNAEDGGNYTNQLYILPDDSVSIALKSIHVDIKTEGDEEAVHTRFFNCPARLTVSHLKKLLRVKFDLPLSHPIQLSLQENGEEILCENYSLIDVAYIKQWQKTAPLLLYYKIYFSKKIKFDPEISEMKFSSQIKSETVNEFFEHIMPKTESRLFNSSKEKILLNGVITKQCGKSLVNNNKYCGKNIRPSCSRNVTPSKSVVSIAPSYKSIVPAPSRTASEIISLNPLTISPTDAIINNNISYNYGFSLLPNSGGATVVPNLIQGLNNTVVPLGITLAPQSLICSPFSEQIGIPNLALYSSTNDKLLLPVANLDTSTVVHSIPQQPISSIMHIDSLSSKMSPTSSDTKKHKRIKPKLEAKSKPDKEVQLTITESGIMMVSGGGDISSNSPLEGVLNTVENEANELLNRMETTSLLPSEISEDSNKSDISDSGIKLAQIKKEISTILDNLSVENNDISQSNNQDSPNDIFDNENNSKKSSKKYKEDVINFNNNIVSLNNETIKDSRLELSENNKNTLNKYRKTKVDGDIKTDAVMTHLKDKPFLIRNNNSNVIPDNPLVDNSIKNKDLHINNLKTIAIDRDNLKENDNKTDKQKYNPTKIDNIKRSPTKTNHIKESPTKTNHIKESSIEINNIKTTTKKTNNINDSYTKNKNATSFILDNINMTPTKIKDTPTKINNIKDSFTKMDNINRSNSKININTMPTKMDIKYSGRAKTNNIRGSPNKTVNSSLIKTHDIKSSPNKTDNINQLDNIKTSYTKTDNIKCSHKTYNISSNPNKANSIKNSPAKTDNITNSPPERDNLFTKTDNINESTNKMNNIKEGPDKTVNISDSSNKLDNKKASPVKTDNPKSSPTSRQFTALNTLSPSIPEKSIETALNTISPSILEKSIETAINTISTSIPEKSIKTVISKCETVSTKKTVAKDSKKKTNNKISKKYHSIGYKTLKKTPKVWNPTIPREKLIIKHAQATTNKFFKARNSIVSESSKNSSNIINSESTVKQDSCFNASRMKKLSDENGSNVAEKASNIKYNELNSINLKENSVKDVSNLTNSSIIAKSEIKTKEMTNSNLKEKSENKVKEKLVLTNKLSENKANKSISSEKLPEKQLLNNNTKLSSSPEKTQKLTFDNKVGTNSVNKSQLPKNNIINNEEKIVTKSAKIKEVNDKNRAHSHKKDSHISPIKQSETPKDSQKASSIPCFPLMSSNISDCIAYLPFTTQPYLQNITSLPGIHYDPNPFHALMSYSLCSTPEHTTASVLCSPKISNNLTKTHFSHTAPLIQSKISGPSVEGITNALSCSSTLNKHPSVTKISNKLIEEAVAKKNSPDKIVKKVQTNLDNNKPCLPSINNKSANGIKPDKHKQNNTVKNDENMTKNIEETSEKSKIQPTEKSKIQPNISSDSQKRETRALVSGDFNTSNKVIPISSTNIEIPQTGVVPSCLSSGLTSVTQLKDVMTVKESKPNCDDKKCEIFEIPETSRVSNKTENLLNNYSGTATLEISDGQIDITTQSLESIASSLLDTLTPENFTSLSNVCENTQNLLSTQSSSIDNSWQSFTQSDKIIDSSQNDKSTSKLSVVNHSVSSEVSSAKDGFNDNVPYYTSSSANSYVGNENYVGETCAEDKILKNSLDLLNNVESLSHSGSSSFSFELNYIQSDSNSIKVTDDKNTESLSSSTQVDKPSEPMTPICTPVSSLSLAKPTLGISFSSDIPDVNTTSICTHSSKKAISKENTKEDLKNKNAHGSTQQQQFTTTQPPIVTHPSNLITTQSSNSDTYINKLTDTAPLATISEDYNFVNTPGTTVLNYPDTTSTSGPYTIPATTMEMNTYVYKTSEKSNHSSKENDSITTGSMMLQLSSDSKSVQHLPPTTLCLPSTTGISSNFSYNFNCDSSGCQVMHSCPATTANYLNSSNSLYLSNTLINQESSSTAVSYTMPFTSMSLPSTSLACTSTLLPSTSSTKCSMAVPIISSQLSTTISPNVGDLGNKATHSQKLQTTQEVSSQQNKKTANKRPVVTSSASSSYNSTPTSNSKKLNQVTSSNVFTTTTSTTKSNYNQISGEYPSSNNMSSSFHDGTTTLSMPNLASASANKHAQAAWNYSSLNPFIFNNNNKEFYASNYGYNQQNAYRINEPYMKDLNAESQSPNVAYSKNLSEVPYSKSSGNLQYTSGTDNSMKKNSLPTENYNNFCSGNQRYNSTLYNPNYSNNYMNFFTNSQNQSTPNLSSLVSGSGYNLPLSNPKFTSGQQYFDFGQNASNNSYFSSGSNINCSANYQNCMNHGSTNNSSNMNSNFGNNFSGSFCNFPLSYYSNCSFSYNSYPYFYQSGDLFSNPAASLMPSFSSRSHRNSSSQSLNDFHFQSGLFPMMPFVPPLAGGNSSRGTASPMGMPLSSPLSMRPFSSNPTSYHQKTQQISDKSNCNNTKGSQSGGSTKSKKSINSISSKQKSASGNSGSKQGVTGSNKGANKIEQNVSTQATTDIALKLNDTKGKKEAKNTGNNKNQQTKTQEVASKSS